MKNNLFLQKLELVNNNKIYSKTNSEYDKIFGKFTLKSFLRSLNKQRIIKKPTFLEEMAEKYPSEEDPSYQELILNKKRNKLKEFFFNFNDETLQKAINTKNPKNSNLIINYKKPIQIDISPNPCSYNPKYDLIFKRIPVATIFNTPTKTENNINNSSITRPIKLKKIIKGKNNNLSHSKYEKIEKLKIDNIKLFINKNKNIPIKKEIFTEEKNNKKKLIKKTLLFGNKTTITENNIRKKIYPLSQDKKNYTYINDIIKINKTNNNNLSTFKTVKKISKKNSIFKTSIVKKLNAKTIHEKKGIFDFNKMSKRNFEIILNNSTLKNPSFYRYNPKYDYIKQSPKAFNFGFNDNKTNFQKKKILLKKMWCSYSNLNKDYNLINNSKLKENVEI